MHTQSGEHVNHYIQRMVNIHNVATKVNTLFVVSSRVVKVCIIFDGLYRALLYTA